MNLKKFTQKDRYGNTMSYEFETPEKPLDQTAIIKHQMDQMQEMESDMSMLMIEPPVMGEEFNMGDMETHPGEPRGSDTVPAWLTPGEFVMNKESVEMFGPEIEQMNEIGRMAKGGHVQYHAGGGLMESVRRRAHPLMESIAKQDPRALAETLASVAQYADLARNVAGFQKGGEIPMPIAPPWSPREGEMESLEALLHEREGFRPDVYLDTLDKPTVGYGHLLPDEYKTRVGEQPFSQEELESFFRDDMATAPEAAIRNVGRETWSGLNEQQRNALASMAFQLGEKGQSKFKKMIKAIQEGDHRTAAKEALTGSKGGKSKWLKQTPKRALDLAEAFDADLAAQYKNAGGKVYDDRPAQYAFLGKLIESFTPTTPTPEINYGDSSSGQIDALLAAGYTPEQAIAAVKNIQAGEQVVPIEGELAVPPKSVPIEGATVEGEIAKDLEQGNPIPYITDSLAHPLSGLLGSGFSEIEEARKINDPNYRTGMDTILDLGKGSGMTPDQAQHNVDISRLNLEEAEATLAEWDARIAAGEPYNEKTYEGIKKSVEHLRQQEKEAEDARIAAIMEQSDEGLIPDWVKGEPYKEKERQEREAAEEAAQAEALAQNEEAYINEAYGGDRNAYEASEEGKRVKKKQKEAIDAAMAANEAEYMEAAYGTQDRKKAEEEQIELRKKSEEVRKAGESASPAEVESTMDKLAEYGLDKWFDKKQLANMAVMYLGSRLMGYDHGGSFNFAMKQYAQGVIGQEANEAAKIAKQQEQALQYGDEYTPESLQNFFVSGNVADLVPLTSATPSATTVGKRYYVPGHGALPTTKIGKEEFVTIDGQQVNVANIQGIEEWDDNIHGDVAVSKRFSDFADEEASTYFEEGDKKTGEGQFRIKGVNPKTVGSEANAIYRRILRNNAVSVNDAPQTEMAVQRGIANFYKAKADFQRGVSEIEPMSLEAYIQQETFTPLTGLGPEIISGTDPKNMRSLDKTIRAGMELKKTDPGYQDEYMAEWQATHQAWMSLDDSTRAEWEKRAADKGWNGFTMWARETPPEEINALIS